MGFARREGAGGLVVVNTRGLRATDPRELLRVADPDGPGNADALSRALTVGSRVVCAWGAHPMAIAPGTAFVRQARSLGVALWCLGKTKDGSPRHPLYLPGDQPLEIYP